MVCIFCGFVGCEWIKIRSFIFLSVAKHWKWCFLHRSPLNCWCELFCFFFCIFKLFYDCWMNVFWTKVYSSGRYHVWVRSDKLYWINFINESQLHLSAASDVTCTCFYTVSECLARITFGRWFHNCKTLNFARVNRLIDTRQIAPVHANCASWCFCWKKIEI